MRKRVILRLTKEAAEGLYKRFDLEGRAATLAVNGKVWEVTVFYQDGEQDGLPLGVQDGPA